MRPIPPDGCHPSLVALDRKRIRELDSRAAPTNSRVDEVLAAEHITDSQEFETESILERIEIVLRGIHTAVNSDGSKERLRASADLLREEVAAADEILDGLLKQR